MKHWYEKARERMSEKGITPEDLAAVLGVTPGAVRHYLVGRRNPKPGALIRIARSLGVSMSELVEDDPRFARDKTEEQVLDLLRTLPAASRAAALMMLKGLSESRAEDAETDA